MLMPTCKHSPDKRQELKSGSEEEVNLHGNWMEDRGGGGGGLLWQGSYSRDAEDFSMATWDFSEMLGSIKSEPQRRLITRSLTWKWWVETQDPHTCKGPADTSDGHLTQWVISIHSYRCPVGQQITPHTAHLNNMYLAVLNNGKYNIYSTKFGYFFEWWLNEKYLIFSPVSGWITGSYSDISFSCLFFFFTLIQMWIHLKQLII